MKKAKILGSIEFDNGSRFSFLDNGHIGVLLNGCELFNEAPGVFESKVSKCIEDMFLRMQKNGNNISFIKGTDEFKTIIKQISENIPTDSVMVLQDKPDEHRENTPSTDEGVYRRFLNAVPNYRQNISEYTETKNNLLNLSEALCRSKFSSSMWGADKVIRRIASIRDDLKEMKEGEENFDRAVEDIGRNEKRMILFVSGRSKSPEAKKIFGQFGSDFNEIKSFMTRLAMSLARLNRIDGVFKKYTGYPATWFFNPSLFYDFQYNYDTLTDHIAGLPNMVAVHAPIVGSDSEYSKL